MKRVVSTAAGKSCTARIHRGQVKQVLVLLEEEKLDPNSIFPNIPR